MYPVSSKVLIIASEGPFIAWPFKSIIKSLNSLSLLRIRADKKSKLSKSSSAFETDKSFELEKSLNFCKVDSPIPLFGTLRTLSKETVSSGFTK